MSDTAASVTRSGPGRCPSGQPRAPGRHQWRDKTELEMELREVERSLEEVEDEGSLWRFLE